MSSANKFFVEKYMKRSRAAQENKEKICRLITIYSFTRALLSSTFATSGSSLPFGQDDKEKLIAGGMDTI